MQRHPRRISLVAAIVLSVIASVGVAFGGSVHSWPDDELSFYYFAEMILLVSWLTAEPRLPKENQPTFDHGYLHWATFPILAMYEQYVCRGGKGIAIVLGFLFLLIAPLVVWVVRLASG